MGLVVLLLFAHEKEANLRIIDHILYLLLARCGIERNRNHANTVGSEVGIEILNAVLCKHSNVLLRLDPKVQEGVADLFHTQRELVPRYSLPLQAAETTEGKRVTLPVFLGLLMYQHRKMTFCLHSKILF